MFLLFSSLVLAQSAAPPAAAPAGWDDTPAGSASTYVDPDFPPTIGELVAPGYCERLRELVPSTGETVSAFFPNLWRANDDKPTKAQEPNMQGFSSHRRDGLDVCIEVALGHKGSYDARHALAVRRAEALEAQSDPYYVAPSKSWATVPAAPVAEAPSGLGKIVVVITDTADDPSTEAGALRWHALRPASRSALTDGDAAPAVAPTAGDTDWMSIFSNGGLDFSKSSPSASAAAPPAAAPPRAASAPTVATVTQAPVSRPAPTIAYTPAVVAAPTPVETNSSALELPSIDGRLSTGRKAKNESAVVIGLEDYAFVPDVPYARRDADAFYNFLLYTRGIPRDKITTITSGSVEHIRKAVQESGESVTSGGTVWVYFAGHGAASPSSRQQVVLGDDVRPDDVSFDARSVPVADIQRLASAGGGNAMLVVDACFSGIGRDGSSLLGGQRALIPAKAVQAVITARQWTATTAGEASVPLDSVQHGAFTYAAVGALRGWADGELGAKDGKVTADEADAYVSRLLRAMQVRDQSPQFTGGTEFILSEGATETGPIQ